MQFIWHCVRNLILKVKKKCCLPMCFDILSHLRHRHRTQLWMMHPLAEFWWDSVWSAPEDYPFLAILRTFWTLFYCPTTLYDCFDFGFHKFKMFFFSYSFSFKLKLKKWSHFDWNYVNFWKELYISRKQWLNLILAAAKIKKHSLNHKCFYDCV